VQLCDLAVCVINLCRHVLKCNCPSLYVRSLLGGRKTTVEDVDYHITMICVPWVEDGYSSLAALQPLTAANLTFSVAGGPALITGSWSDHAHAQLWWLPVVVAVRKSCVVSCAVVVRVRQGCVDFITSIRFEIKFNDRSGNTVHVRTAPLIRSRLRRFINLLTYLLNYLLSKFLSVEWPWSTTCSRPRALLHQEHYLANIAQHDALAPAAVSTFAIVQEAQLSQRGRATLRVIENLAVLKDHSRLFKITLSSRAWIGCNCNYSSILYDVENYDDLEI